MPVFFALVSVGALLRLFHCFQAPFATTDLLRNIGYGKAFHEYGFQIYDLTPCDLSPWPSQFLWESHHYTYPWATILFFGLVTGIHSSMFFSKLVLCVLDVVNAFLAYKITRDRWTALLYWLNPIVLWYGSQEGQFEPYVAFWMLSAILALHKKKPYAYGLLGIAIQTKLFPVFLGPYFLLKMSWREPKRLIRQFGWALASAVPTVWAMSQSQYLMRLFSSGYVPRVNPITWSLGSVELYAFYPYWIVLLNFLMSICFIFLCFWAVKRGADFMELVPALLFLVIVKSSQIGQFWYLILLPAFCLTVREQRLRRLLMLAAAIMGAHAFYLIAIGPIGYENPPALKYLLDKAFWGF